jgi:ubiquinone/menaquinone biosynthesis C-methylase UbiE
MRCAPLRICDGAISISSVSTATELPSDYPPPGMELRLIRRFVDPKGRRVLEIGCGDGRLTREYARLTKNVLAIEPDPASISEARRAFAAEGITNVSFRVGSAQRVRFGGGAFDIALFSWSL